MSTISREKGLTSVLMRSSTPAPNEKVLKYLDGIAIAQSEGEIEAEDYHDELRSNRSGVSRHSRTVGSPSQNGAVSPRSQNGQILQELAGSPVSYERLLSSDQRLHEAQEDEDDMASDVQQRSEGGTALPVPEPGPHDAPGPHYISYGSSFGNLGPLPTDDFPQNAHNLWTNPVWTPDPSGAQVPWNLNTGNSFEGGLGLENVASRGSSIAIGVESPTNKTRTRSQAPSRASEKQPSEHRSQPPASPKAGSRAPTARTAERPFSPQSVKSYGTSKTRPTENGTAYPPLPESRFDDESMHDGPSLPARSRAARSKAPSKAASVSPSDSLSQVNIKRYKSPSHREGSNVNQSEAGVNGADFSPRSTVRQVPVNGNGRVPMSPTNLSHQSRPFSPYHHAPTQEDLLAAAARGRGMVITEEEEEEEPAKASSVAHSKMSKASRTASTAPSASPSHRTRQSAITNGKAPSKQSSVAPSKQPSVAPSKQPSVAPSKQPSVAPSQQSRASRKRDVDATPTPSRPHTPDMDELNQEEARIVEQALASAVRTPRTSYYTPSALDAEVQQSSFHDNELCILLHQLKAPQTHELVRKVVLKAVKQRMKKLSMKYDNESIKHYQKTYHNHDPIEELPVEDSDEPPRWASDLKREILLMQQRIESLGPKIENLRPPPPPQSYAEEGNFYDDDQYTTTPVTQTVNIHTQATGTMAESMYQPETEMTMEDAPLGGHLENDAEFEDDGEITEPTHRGFPAPAIHQTRTPPNYALSDDRDDSPGQQYLEEELYKLHQRPSATGEDQTTWDLRRSDVPDEYDEEAPAVAPTIPGSETGDFGRRSASPPLPPIPRDDTGQRSLVQQYNRNYNDPQQDLPPWQKIHQRLLSWAIVWPLSELDEALNSTTRGHQVNEVAMSIWSTQTYKRYVRSRMTDTPSGVVDRLFVPPNMADAISNAVFNGRHGDACGMLRDLWTPFGLQGMPRLLVVLAKHRNDENHWVVHRFSLPDGALTTYDSYPERNLPDGRPLAWWFAIRVAWSNAIYPSPDKLMQKIVRLHRPMQLPIDNSVSAGGIWRNILMGSRAERSLDLERLRDLINTEVKNLRQRKLMGKLSINAPRPQWEDMS
ncbi:hypothetical protein DFH05DRAFT_589324 [Lentinula detonsa]|uniref:Uncharacterized protein n=1 Tax=Lentinula detonsa TaxID=2804962 RepID=A0A9W8P7T2_9AGAR|nr:hypothetical protein DFH05DRAFT_589324 [Lentinula detonsa]